MSQTLRYVFAALTITVSLVPARAQTPYLKQHDLIKGQRNYKTLEVFQDNQGFIWFGTNRGLVKFDGVNYQLFTQEHGLSGIEVTAFCQDTSDQLWISHENGSISILTDGAFNPFEPEAGLGTIPVTDLMVDSSGHIWFSTMGEGVYYFSGRRLYNLNMDDGLADNYAYCLEPGSDGDVWIGTDYGISVYSARTEEFRHFSMKDGLPDNIVKDIRRIDPDNYLIATDEQGVVSFNLRDEEFMVFRNWDFGSINNIVVSEGDIWISTESDGIVKLFIDSDGTYLYKQVNVNHGLASDRTEVVFIDREQNLWVGTNNGVSQGITPVFEFLNRSHQLPFEMVYSFLIDDNNFYWVCSEKGLYQLTASQTEGFMPKRIFSGSKYEEVHFISLYEDADNYIWAGSYDYGVFRINPATMNYTRYSTHDGLADNNIISITGNDREIVFSTLGGGISICNTGTDQISFSNYSQSNGKISSNYVYSTFIDSRNRIWVAEASNSFCVLSQDEVINFSQKDSVFGSSFYSFAEDNSGSIWLTTEDQGVYCYTGERFINFDEDNGLRSSEIKSIITDKYDHLVLVSNEGIDIFHHENKYFTRFGENYGVAYQEPFVNSIYEDRNGHIWIGTANGLIKYNPERLFADTLSPLVFISGKTLFYEPIPDGRKTFRHSEHSFTFDFTGLWYQDPDQLIYRFQLEGHDMSWSSPTRTRTTTYPRVPPGSYRFRVEASLDNNVWIGSDQATYSFTIKPPFWQRWWFIISMIVLVLVAIVVVFRARLAALKRAKKRLEEEVAKATHEIREKNEELETQKNEIEAQRDLVMDQRDQIAGQQKELQSSIRYALRIQKAVMTPESEVSRMISDYFILNMPRDIVSGDFYWVAEKHGHLFWAVADSTGHGVPGAFVSMLGISAFNEVLSGECGKDAGEFLFRLRDRVKKALHHAVGETETPDGMDAALCILEKEAGKLTFAGAQNPLYLIRDGKLTEYKGDKMPIGSHYHDQEPFTVHSFNIRKGDSLYLFSDGYPDQFGGTEGKKFKYKPFKRKLLEIQQESMAKQKEILQGTIRSWMGEYEQIDDILVFGVRF